MNFSNLGISYQSLTSGHIDEQIRVQRRNKVVLLAGIIIISGLLVSMLVIAVFYIATRKQQTSVFVSSSTAKTPSDTSTYNVISILANVCVQQSVEYIASGKPLQNFTRYPIDASLLIPEAVIYLNITMYPPNVGCTWSLDIFPMDGRVLPTSGEKTNSVFGRYDLDQDSTVEYRNAGKLKDWGAGTGKFIVGFTGAWYGTAGIGCKGNGTMTLCFSHL